MHENRETSETPAAQPGRRSAGEGLSHKDRAYVCEESHNGIVSMNHSNKDKPSLAESGEGRPVIRENVRQPNTSPTQSRERVSQGLAGVRKAAGNNKEMKFTALLHHLTVERLRESSYSLNRKAAPGVDGVTWQEYEDGLEDRLTDLHGRVHRGAYRATPSRRVYVEKEDGRQRPLASGPGYRRNRYESEFLSSTGLSHHRQFRSYHQQRALHRHINRQLFPNDGKQPKHSRGCLLSD